jgi:hypothetical protein
MVRYLVDQNTKGKHVNSLAFGDPHMLSMQSINYDRNSVRDYIVHLLVEYSARDSILLPYNTG